MAHRPGIGNRGGEGDTECQRTGALHRLLQPLVERNWRRERARRTTKGDKEKVNQMQTPHTAQVDDRRGWATHAVDSAERARSQVVC